MSSRRLAQLAIFLVFALFNAVLWRPVLKAIADRSSACPLRLVLSSFGEARRFRASEARLRQALRLLKDDPAGYHLWDTPAGPVWIPAHTDHELPILLAEGEQENCEPSRTCVRTGDIVLDCGAHVGLYTRLALSRGAALVVAIEPAPENLECLRRNLAGEITAGRVIVSPKGVWDRNEWLVLERQPRSSATARVVEQAGQSGEESRVPLTTIDALVEELKLARIDYIKMDIEGAELRALAGAQQTLAKHKPRLAVAGYHDQHDGERVPPLVRRARPEYRMECGSCFSPLGIRPEMLHFY